MFFRKSNADGRKRKPKAGGQNTSPRKNTKPKATKTQRPRRRLDSVVVQIRPQAAARRSLPPLPPPSAERGAPLAPETWWLLEQMSALNDIENYRLFKEAFIVLYLSNPLHDPASAARAFYSAVQTCRRRLGR